MSDTIIKNESDLDIGPIMARIRDIVSRRESEARTQAAGTAEEAAGTPTPLAGPTPTSAGGQPTLVGSLELIAQHLAAMQARIAHLEDARRQESERQSKISAQLDDLTSVVAGLARRIDTATTRMAELEQGWARDQEETRCRSDAVRLQAGSVQDDRLGLEPQGDRQAEVGPGQLPRATDCPGTTAIARKG